jgi:serine O-acetyltransferase
MPSNHVEQFGFDALRIDLRRKRVHYTRIDNFVNKYIKMTLQWGSLAVMAFRLEQQVRAIKPVYLGQFLYFIVAILTSILRYFTDCSINSQGQVGRGLVLHNFAGIELDAERAGENLTVNQNVCIGYDYLRDGKPRLGDNVFIGAGAKVLGNINIGNNVVIAANALVITSIPDNCSVVGNPAKIVSRGVTSDYLNFDVT